MTLLKTGEKIDAGKKYVVSGWASINEGTEGPAVYDVVAQAYPAHQDRAAAAQPPGQGGGGRRCGLRARLKEDQT